MKPEGKKQHPELRQLDYGPMMEAAPDYQDECIPNPMKRMDEAEALARSGRYDAALEIYLWCFDHGEHVRPSFTGVRTSFLICDILQLAKKYRPALDALVTRRNACGSRLQTGVGTLEDADNYVSLNRYFRQQDYSVHMFEALPCGSDVWLSIGWSLRDFFLEYRRYSDLLAIFNPEDTFNRNVRDLEISACDGNSGFKTALRDKLVRQCAPLVEALAATGEHQRALALATGILRAVRRPTLRQVLISHAERAGDMPLAKALHTSKRERTK